MHWGFVWDLIYAFLERQFFVEGRRWAWPQQVGRLWPTRLLFKLWQWRTFELWGSTRHVTGGDNYVVISWVVFVEFSYLAICHRRGLTGRSRNWALSSINWRHTDHLFVIYHFLAHVIELHVERWMHLPCTYFSVAILIKLGSIPFLVVQSTIPLCCLISAIGFMYSLMLSPKHLHFLYIW